MTGFLASVRSLEEAHLVQASGVDILDLKEPKEGALGAVSPDLIRQVVSAFRGQTTISATIGDHPCDDSTIQKRIKHTADLGVDFVKVGWFQTEQTDVHTCLKTIRAATDTQIIIVMFADQMPSLDLIDAIVHSGINGVMIDTADKRAGSLLDILHISDLHHFVTRARDQALITGLAGSLREEDIPELVGLQADYLGFRGALCAAHNRQSQLDPLAVRAVHQRIIDEERDYGAVA